MLLLCLSGLLLAASGCQRSEKEFENLASLCCTLREHSTLSRGIDARPISSAFSHDGRWLAAGGMISGTAPQPSSGEVLLWDLSAAEKFRALRFEAPRIGPVVFSSDSKLLAVVARDAEQRDRVVLFDVATGSVLWTIVGHTGEISALAFSPDNRTLVTCAATLVISAGWQRGEIRIWNLEKKVELARAERSEDPFMSVAFIAGGRRFVTGVGKRSHTPAAPGNLVLWDLETCKALRTSDWDRKSITSIVCVPGKDILVAGSQDGALSFWNASDPKLIDSYDARPKDGMRMYVMSVSASRDAKLLAVAMGYWIKGGGAGELQLWDIQERRKCSTLLITSRRPVNCALFSPAADVLACTIGDGRVKIWEVNPKQTPKP